MSKEYLALKWGTIKGYNYPDNEKAMSILKEWYDLGVSVSAMMQENTPEHKKLMCDLVDATEGKIYNDWSGETYDKEKAKDYIMNYGTKY